MKTKTIVFLILIFGVAGVLAFFLFGKQTPDEQVIRSMFGCAGNKTVDATFTQGKVALALSDGRAIELPIAMSASGARYANSDETFVFWNKGDSAFIEEQGHMTYTDCIEVGSGTPTQSTSVLNMTKTYTPTEVAKHGTANDCWMVIENNVYDVTAFVGNHPGGKAILNGCGKDATTLFNQRPTNNQGPHPTTARDLLPTYMIGVLNSNP